jgi:hypothetical protein
LNSRQFDSAQPAAANFVELQITKSQLSILDTALAAPSRLTLRDILPANGRTRRANRVARHRHRIIFLRPRLGSSRGFRRKKVEQTPLLLSGCGRRRLLHAAAGGQFFHATGFGGSFLFYHSQCGGVVAIYFLLFLGCGVVWCGAVLRLGGVRSLGRALVRAWWKGEETLYAVAMRLRSTRFLALGDGMGTARLGRSG